MRLAFLIIMGLVVFLGVALFALPTITGFAALSSDANVTSTPGGTGAVSVFPTVFYAVGMVFALGVIVAVVHAFIRR